MCSNLDIKASEINRMKKERESLTKENIERKSFTYNGSPDDLLNESHGWDPC